MLSKNIGKRMEQTIIDAVEVAEFCSSLSQVTTEDISVLTLNIIPDTLSDKLIPGTELTTEIFTNTIEIPAPESQPKKEKKFKCSFCDFSFSLSGDRKRHELTHTGVKQFKCDVCEDRFARATTLKIHKMRHSNEKPFPCDMCGAAFALSSRLKRHKMSHSGERPFKCDICDRTFIVRRDLRVHQKTHTERETKIHRCDLCETMFSHKSTLKAHKKREHVNRTLFKCKVCDTAFQSSGELKEHKRIHVGEKIFKCDVCENSFARKLTLKRHKLTHSGLKNYRCDICGSAFSRGNTLKIHRMTHTEDKPFKCETCSASFALNVRLKRHKMIHSGERPFKCEACSATFAFSNRLKRHAATHIENSSKKNCDKNKGSFDSHQSKLTNRNLNQRSKSTQDTVKRSATKKVKTLVMKRENKSLVCQICGKKFLQEKRYKTHIDGHTINERKSNISGSGMLGPDPNKEVILEMNSEVQKKKKSLFCDVRQFSTVSGSKFKQHKKVHEREMECPKTHHYHTRRSSRLSKKMSESITPQNSESL